jgi:hypothetical protein
VDKTLSEILAFSIMSIAIEQFVQFIVWLALLRQRRARLHALALDDERIRAQPAQAEEG